ncbi:uncharacterized protein C8orf48 homolog [Notamacropus eugenii]|uniref:uncharacterized protein C8orf48 homolog n=1 Tax=Notamacropus eugenii TaxID=9315 RepID=UPI003B66E12F
MEFHKKCKSVTPSPGGPGASKDKLLESDQIGLSQYSSEISQSCPKEGEEDENYMQTEGNPSGSFSSSGQFKTLPHTSESNIVSKMQTNLKNETKLLNVTDPIALENECLKAKENVTAENQQDTNLQKEVGEITEGELDALRSFCTTRINSMSNLRKKSRTKKLQHKSGVENPVLDKSNLVLPVQQVNGLSLQDSKAQVRKITGVKEHNSEHSSDHDKKGDLKQIASQIEKKTFLESTRAEEKMEEYKYVKDILILIGEIHKNLPRLSDDPEKIWKRLNIQGHTR